VTEFQRLIERAEITIVTAEIGSPWPMPDPEMERAEALDAEGLLADGVTTAQAAHAIACEHLRCLDHPNWPHLVAVGLADRGILTMGVAA